MTKFEIKTDSFEFRFGRSRESVPAMSADEIFDTYLSCDDRITSNSLDPVLEASFDSLEEAKSEFAKNYANYGCTRLEHGSVLWLLCGELAWIESNEYDDDGEFDQGGETFAVSAEAYEPEEDEED